MLIYLGLELEAENAAGYNQEKHPKSAAAEILECVAGGWGETPFTET